MPVSVCNVNSKLFGSVRKIRFAKQHKRRFESNLLTFIPYSEEKSIIAKQEMLRE